MGRKAVGQESDRRPRSAAEEARRIEADIASLARQLQREMFGAAASEPLRISLDLSLGGEEKPGALLSELKRALQRAAAGRDSYRAGRVHCYRCESPTCEHSAPPGPLSVFSGYGPTGLPRWSDFAQHLLDAKDERVDELFGELPGLVARFATGRELKGRQLHPFGRASKSYDLLSQL